MTHSAMQFEVPESPSHGVSCTRAFSNVAARPYSGPRFQVVLSHTSMKDIHLLKTLIEQDRFLSHEDYSRDESTYYIRIFNRSW